MRDKIDHCGQRLCTLLVTIFLSCTLYAANSAESVSIDGKFPAYLLEVPDTVADVLIADTESATMYRFSRSNGAIVAVDQRYMSIGTAGVGKQKAWDKKTPLGVYFITESLDTSKLHDKYGVAAFPLDYPNAWDRFNQRTGDGIWLHGVDKNNPERPPLDTDGCLALANEDLMLLIDLLKPLVTPVIVVREVKWATPGDIEERRLEFRLALDQWRESFAAGDIYTYLSLYADDFRFEGLNRDEWAAFSYKVFENRILNDVTLNDVMLVADPEVPGLYLSRFTQVLMTADGAVTSNKRLYWQRSDENRWKIISEDAD